MPVIMILFINWLAVCKKKWKLVFGHIQDPGRANKVSTVQYVGTQDLGK